MNGRKVGAARKLCVLVAALGAVLVFNSTASAGHYHTNCVGHGMVHGSSTTDGSWHARVEGGCGNPGLKTCTVRAGSTPVYTSLIGTGNSATCNQWSSYCCTEQSGTAWVAFNGVFSGHSHSAH